MRTNALAALDCSEETEKRAQWEGFEFAVDGDVVQVRNTSHDDPTEHTYDVQLDDRDVPASCTCPAYEYHAGACKHMAAVAIREPVLEAARSARTPDPDPTPATDGGIIEADDDGVILEASTGPAHLDVDAESAAAAIHDYYRYICATHDCLGYVPAVRDDDGELAVSRGGLIRYPDRGQWERPSVLVDDVPRYHQFTRPTWRSDEDWREVVAERVRTTIVLGGETYRVDADEIAAALRDGA